MSRNKTTDNKPLVKELFSVMDENAPEEYVAAYKMLCTIRRILFGR